MKHGSLFSGIGGFDLAAEWMGWENVFHCEIDEFLRKELQNKWPYAKSYADIKTTSFKLWRDKVHILTGGDPCQPHSNAGLRKGKEDDRYLWPEFIRAIRESRPIIAVNENVDGSVTNGIIDLKIDDLESEGYTCQAYDIPASAVGAIHQRRRIWLVAINTNGLTNYRNTRQVQKKSDKEWLQKRNRLQFVSEPVNLWPFDTYTNSQRLKEQYDASKSTIFQEGLSRYFGFGTAPHGHISRDIIKSGIIRMLDGLPEGMDYTKRSKRIHAIGNAIVPQVSYQIFKSIQQYINLNTPTP